MVGGGFKFKKKQELSLKRLVGRVEEINTTLDFIFQYLVIHGKINPRSNSRLYKIFQQKAGYPSMRSSN